MSLLFPLITIILILLRVFCMFIAINHNRNMQLMFEKRRALSAASLHGRSTPVEPDGK